ncbi:hypothetical protein ACLOJK_039192 [Asimina triloba]
MSSTSYAIGNHRWLRSVRSSLALRIAGSLSEFSCFIATRRLEEECLLDTDLIMVHRCGLLLLSVKSYCSDGSGHLAAQIAVDRARRFGDATVVDFAMADRMV